MATFIKRKLFHVDSPDAEDLIQGALEGLSKDWFVYWQYRVENQEQRAWGFHPRSKGRDVEV